MAQLSPEEQRLLEVASGAGAEFSVAAVAAGLATAVEEVEERCVGLARRTLFVQPHGITEWPDGLHLEQRTGNHTRQLWAQVLLAQVLYQTGEFAPAYENFLQAMVLYDPQRHSPYASDVAHDPRVPCLANLAEVLWLRGSPDQALQRSQEALTLAQRLAHAHSQVVALASAVLMHSWRGEQGVACGLAEEQTALACAHGFPHWLAVGTFRQGWTVVAQGHPAAGMAQMHQGLAAFQATGAQMALPGFLCDLARAHEIAGQVDEALALIADALTRVHNTGEHHYEAELYRLRGELLLTQVDKKLAEVEAHFWKAITLARQQRAASLELRAVLSLSRLWRQQGKAPQARQMLTQMYGRFTEGFDTMDLQKAKTLLDALT